MAWFLCVCVCVCMCECLGTHVWIQPYICWHMPAMACVQRLENNFGISLQFPHILNEICMHFTHKVCIDVCMTSGWGLGRKRLQQVRRALASYRRPRFSSQNQHGGWKPPAAPVPGDPMLSSDLTSLNTHGVHTYMQTKHPPHKIKYLKKKNLKYKSLKDHIS